MNGQTESPDQRLTRIKTAADAIFGLLLIQRRPMSPGALVDLFCVETGAVRELVEIGLGALFVDGRVATSSELEIEPRWPASNHDILAGASALDRFKSSGEGQTGMTSAFLYHYGG